jgi:hypothetical protein
MGLGTAGAFAACGLEIGGNGSRAAEDGGGDVTLHDAPIGEASAADLVSEPAEDANDGGPDGDANVDADAAPAIVIQINVNGVTYTGQTPATAGVWEHDPGDGGSVCVGTLASASTAIYTPDNPLYIGEVYGSPVDCNVGKNLPHGEYDVTLLFAEFFFGPGCPRPEGGVGSRVFDIRLEGMAVDTNVDIFALGGCVAKPDGGKPVFKKYRQTVNDGTLTIQLKNKVEDAKISAIRVEGPF